MASHSEGDALRSVNDHAVGVPTAHNMVLKPNVPLPHSLNNKVNLYVLSEKWTCLLSSLQLV